MGNNKILSFLEQNSTEKPGWLLTLGVFILAAIPRFTALKTFLAHDETNYWEWSHFFFFALLRGQWLETIVGPGNPSITLFWNQALNMGLKYGWAWLMGIQEAALTTWPDFQLDPTLDLLIQRRLPIVLFNTLAVALAYRLLHKLYGGRIALFAAVFLALDPFYLADSRTLRGEGVLASLAILAILTFLIYWAFEQPRYLVFSGVITGLAWLTKISAVSLVIWVIIAAPILAWAKFNTLGKKQLKWILVTWLAWGFLIGATFWLLWPAMWVSPAKAIGYIASFTSNVGVTGRDNYFFGQVFNDELLPSYYLVVYVLRVSPLTWLGLLAAFGYFGETCLRRSHFNFVNSENSQPLLTALILAFALIYGAMMTVGTLKRDWYLLPAFPALDIVAAVGLVWALQWSWQRRAGRPPDKDSTQMAWGVALGATLILQLITILPAYPYYYTYWNPLVLGSRWAAEAVMVGWDQDLSAGAYYLNSQPHAEELSAATASTRGFEQIFKGRTIRWAPQEPWIQANYLALRRNHFQLQKLQPYIVEYVSHLKLDHVVTLNGVDYFWIYEGPQAEYFAGPSLLTGKAMLFGYDLSQSNIEAGDALSIKLYWQNDGMTADDDFFVQLVDAGDYVWAEAVAEPLPDFKATAFIDEQIVESQATLLVPPGTPPGDYFLRSGVSSRARQETVGYFDLPAEGTGLTVTRPAESPSTTVLLMEHRLEARIAPDISLLGFDLLDDTLILSDKNWLKLYWQANAPPGKDYVKDYVIGLQLLNLAGEEVTYWLGRPVMSGYPTNEWTSGEIVHDPWRLDIPAKVPPGDYSLQLALFDAEAEVEAGRVTLGNVSVMDRRRQFDIPAMQNTINTGLGEPVSLLGYDLFTEPLTGGARLRITLYWQARQAMEKSYTVFVHLLGPDGALVAQNDSLPVGGAIPTNDWSVGEVVADQHFLEFPTPPPGQYKLVIGLYNPATGERLHAPDGNTFILLQTLLMN